MQGSSYFHSSTISPLLYRSGTPGGWPGFSPLSRHLLDVCIPQTYILLWRKLPVKGQHWKGCCDAEEGLPLKGDLAGPCVDMGFGFKGGRNFQKICLLRDRMSSCLHSCEFHLRRNSRTVCRNSQEGGIEGGPNTGSMDGPCDLLGVASIRDTEPLHSHKCFHACVLYSIFLTREVKNKKRHSRVLPSMGCLDLWLRPVSLSPNTTSRVGNTERLLSELGSWIQ